MSALHCGGRKKKEAEVAEGKHPKESKTSVNFSKLAQLGYFLVSEEGHPAYLNSQLTARRVFRVDRCVLLIGNNSENFSIFSSFSGLFLFPEAPE